MNKTWDIPGLDTEKGISMTGGKEDFYMKVLALFCEDVMIRLPQLEAMPEDLSVFAGQAHALKGACASIGAEEVSSHAALLEQAGKAGDAEFVQENLGSFVKEIGDLVKIISGALEKMENAETEAPSSLITQYIQLLSTALKSENIAEIDRLIDEIGRQHLEANMKAALDQISDEVLMAEFANAVEIINNLKKQGAV